MDVNHDMSLAIWGMQVVLALFKQVLRAQFGYPVFGVMVPDSSGHPGPEIHWIVFSIPFFHEELFSYLSLNHLIKKIVLEVENI